MNYKLFVFLFALFVTCTPNFLLKKKIYPARNCI